MTISCYMFFKGVTECKTFVGHRFSVWITFTTASIQSNFLSFKTLSIHFVIETLVWIAYSIGPIFWDVLSMLCSIKKNASKSFGKRSFSLIHKEFLISYFNSGSTNTQIFLNFLNHPHLHFIIYTHTFFANHQPN